MEELIKNELFNTSEILIWQKQTALEFLKVSELRSLEIDTLSLEDILSLDIHEYYKIILKFWYYALNKYPLKTILLELKSLIAAYQNTEFINVLSKLQKYFNTKRKFVDKVFYLNLLDDAMYIILRDKRTPQKRSL